MENQKEKLNNLEETEKIEASKKKTMSLSIVEGTISGLGTVAGDNYIVPFSIQLGANEVSVGIFSSIVGIIGPISQIFSSNLMHKHSRRALVTKGVLYQSLMWIPIIIVGLFYWFNIISSSLPLIALGLYLILVFVANIAGPPWFSMMGDIVPDNKRGQYFAKRNIIVNSVALAGILFLSIFVNILEQINMVIWGFILIFVIASSSRFISALLFRNHYYPEFKIQKTDTQSLLSFIKDIPKTNFGIFTIFVACMQFGRMIAGPYFIVYMIKELEYDYSLAVIINLSASFFSLFFFQIIGKIGDKVGNVRLIQIGSVIIPILPFLWVFSFNPYMIIFLPQLLSGFGWTAFNFACSNFIYDNVPQQKRGHFVAYYNLILGIGILIGGVFGTILFSLAINLLDFNNYHFIFIVSGIIRGIVSIIFIKKIKEVRIAKIKKL